ncbi:MAG: LCP family protein [Christensenella sp.]|nr:LCP family protein [Christensenella sp.]
MSKVMKIILIVLLVVVLSVVGVGMYVLSSMRSNAVQTVAKPTEDLTATTEEPQTIKVISDDPTPSPTPMPIYEEKALDESVVNILLIGTDSRSADESENSEGRSDSMILASLNTDTGKITLVSFMRDARVHRVGESGRFTFYNKLNGAYRGGYGGGGAGELIKTINGNFGLDIDQYIAIGFDGFAALIDKIGGLDVELDQPEINFINDRIKGDHELEPAIVKNAKTIDAAPGLIHLDGAQCLIYARNRHTGTDGSAGNDFERVNRQQEIIQLVYKKVTSSMNEQSVLALLSFASNYITTNLKLETMASLAKVLLTSNMEFTSTTIPEAGTYKNYTAEKVNSETGETTYEKTDQLEFNIKKAASSLQILLYGVELTPTPKPTPEP